MATATDVKLDDTTPFKRKEAVVAAVDMPGIPAGTRGKVIMVAGFTWIRYWVRFENGVERGSINREKLVRPDEPYGEERARLLALAMAPAPTSNGDAAEGTPAADSGEGVVYNGVLVPAHLLQRSKDRRAALGK